MASGVLGQKVITSSSSGAGLVVYTVPSSTLAVCNIRIVNVSSAAQTVDLAIPNETDGTFDGLDALEDAAPLAVAAVLENTNIVLEAGRSVVVPTTGLDSTGVNVVVTGIEESTS